MHLLLLTSCNYLLVCWTCISILIIFQMKKKKNLKLVLMIKNKNYKNWKIFCFWMQLLLLLLLLLLSTTITFDSTYLFMMFWLNENTIESCIFLVALKIKCWMTKCERQILQSRSVLRPNKLVGSFKLDVATVWNQEGK